MRRKSASAFKKEMGVKLKEIKAMSKKLNDIKKLQDSKREVINGDKEKEENASRKS